MTKAFINLASSDLERSKAFYTALGCEINPFFTDENAACVVWSEEVYFMVLTREFFASFTHKPIADPTESLQVVVAFSRAPGEDVDDILAAGASPQGPRRRGLAAGASEPKPVQDLGFMYSRHLDDPDGNSLGFLYMTPEAVENGPE